MLDSTIAQRELSSQVISWSRPRRLLFRFVFCYLALYLCPTPISEGLLGFIPGSSAVSQAIARAWMKSLPWFAAHLFRFSGPAVSVYR